MIMSAILDALTSKEILTVIGLCSVTTVAATIKKLFHTEAFASKFKDNTVAIMDKVFYLVVLLLLCGFCFSLLGNLFNVVETVFFI